jgi:ATP-dependent Clp protease protease subunit
MNRSPFHRSPVGLQIVAGANEVDVMLYDEIGMFGITAKEFKTRLDGIKAKTINLRVNSPGGDVFDGLAIYNALREHPAKVITHVDGVAASISSVIAMAGDEVRMAENAFLMVHNPWSLVMGSAADLRKEADLLDKVGGSLVMAYVEKTGMSAEQVQSLMDAETWFTAEEADVAGFVDSVIQPEDKKTTKAEFDLSIYAHVPDALTASGHDPTIRELERALRDAGLSQIAAKQFVSAGRAAATQRDVEDAGERDVTPEPVQIEVPVDLLIGF